MIKILHVIPGYGGGISSFVKNLSSANNNEKIIIDVIGFSKYDENFSNIVHKQKGKLFTLPNIHRSPIKCITMLYNIMKKNRYDILHCHISGYKGMLFKVLGKFFGMKIITHAHRSSDEKKGIGYKYQVILSQFFSRFFSDSYFACSKIAAIHIFGENILKKKNVVYINNSINIEKFLEPISKDEYKKYLNTFHINNDSLIIGHIGRFNIQKNHKFMLKIASRLKEKDINFVLLFIGEGELENEIKKESKAIEIEDKVRFLGRREDVSKLLHIFDVFILPSFFEGLPTVAIESQAAGIPTIVSNKISNEADMQMNLIKYLSIDDVEEWITELIEIRKIKIPSIEERRKKMILNGYTINEMYKKYINSIIFDLKK